MKINFDDNVHPFFQVMVKKVDKKVTASEFFKKFKEIVAKKNRESGRQQFEIIQPLKMSEIKEDDFLAILIKHTSVPTWYWSNNPIKLNVSRSGLPLDIENDLIVFYYKEDFVFVHSNCDQILKLVNDVQDEIFSLGGARFRKLNGQQINLILGQFKFEYRSLGIQNHFGLGGTAPDGKTYHGRDTSASLTPSFDAGYGFSYCIAAKIPPTGKPEPFGCSKNKSKIWTTWVADLNAFCNQCDNIVKWLNNRPGSNNQLEVLVKAVSKTIIPSLEIVEFFLDYFVMERGTVFIGKDRELTSDWNCHYDTNKKIIYFSTILDGGELVDTSIELKYDRTNEIYVFSYLSGEDELEISIHDLDAKSSGRNTEDLVDFLNEQQHFTILYDKEYAYRGEDCWEDSRLNRTFKHSTSEINWKRVDIKKENKTATKGKINILEAIEDFFNKDSTVLFSSNDNGANEIADYLVFYENRFILVHAKYASNQIPSLIIDDIQVVASQAIKNIRFFVPSVYNEKIIERLFKNKRGKSKLVNKTKFKEKLLSVLQNKDTVKECWIVQPGISLSKLKNDPKNKMHTILNFVHSVLLVNGIQFKLVASQK